MHVTYYKAQSPPDSEYTESVVQYHEQVFFIPGGNKMAVVQGTQKLKQYQQYVIEGGNDMWQLEAWENELFDQYNGEGYMTQEEFEANAWDELEQEGR